MTIVPRWTREEDAKLRRLRENGVTWVAMGPHFEGRSSGSCERRYRLLQDYAARGINPYEVVPGPPRRPDASNLPIPFGNPFAAEIGCQAHHEALMRFYRNRELRNAA